MKTALSLAKLASIVLGCAALAACTAPAAEEDDASTAEDLTKRVGGSGSYGKIAVAAFPWYSPGRSENTLTVDGKIVTFGKAMSLPPGTHPVAIVSHGVLLAPEFKLPAITIVGGQTALLDAPGAVTMRRAEALTWEGDSTGPNGLAKDGKIVVADLGRGMDGVDRASRGRDFLVPAGDYAILSGDTALPVSIGAGMHVEARLLAAKVSVETDPIDPSFPDPKVHNGEFFVSDVYGNHVEYLRKFGTRTVRPGAKVIVKNAWGWETSVVASPSKPATIAVHRLEIEPLSITKDGTTAPALTHVRIERKTAAGGWKSPNASFYAPIGLDVLDGDYRVTLEATYDGGITEVQEVTFP